MSENLMNYERIGTSKLEKFGKVIKLYGTRKNVQFLGRVPD